MSESENVLYFGDNLDVMRRYIADESVDLVYLDPSFKSGQALQQKSLPEGTFSTGG